MRIEQLEYFLEIAKTHSISLAAENLFVTQPTISDAMKKLETELDIPLLIRSKNGVYLTEAGEAILPAAQRALAEIQTITKTIAQFKNAAAKTLSGHLQIHAASAISLNVLPKALANFYSRYPQVTLTIIEKNGRDIWQDEAEPFDLKLFTATDQELELLPVSDDETLLPLWTDRFYAFVHKNIPLASQKSVTLKELCQYPLAALAYYNHDNSFLASIFGDNLNPHIVFRSSNREHIFQSVSQGHSVYVGQSIAGKLPENIIAVPINDSRKLKAYALHNTESPNLPLINAFLAILKEAH